MDKCVRQKPLANIQKRVKIEVKFLCSATSLPSNNRELNFKQLK